MNNISIKFGRKQPKMRFSKLTPGCFGPYHNETYDLQVGSEQSIQFGENVEGPIYMSEQERREK